MGSMLCGAVQHMYIITLIINNKPDSKRQQTTTVDNKRLFNGLVLKWFASLRHNSNSLGYGPKEKENPGCY